MLSLVCDTDLLSSPFSFTGCDCCMGPLYGKGFRFILIYRNVYGLRLPYQFSACSPDCYTAFVKSAVPIWWMVMSIEIQAEVKIICWIKQASKQALLRVWEWLFFCKCVHYADLWWGSCDIQSSVIYISYLESAHPPPRVTLGILLIATPTSVSNVVKILAPFPVFNLKKMEMNFKSFNMN